MEPLEGITCLEMGTFGPATFAAGLLADLGMTVIRVEPPPHPSRAVTSNDEIDGDNLPKTPGGIYWQRNKKSIVLNLKSPEARAILYQLVEEADVLIEANRPGVLKRLEVDYETLLKRNPDIIYCSVTGFGQTGPYRNKPGHDPCWQGIGGMLTSTGIGLGNFGNLRAGPPELPSRLVTHHTTPYYAAIAILAALWSREATGCGQHIDISNCDAVAAVPYNPQRSFSSGKSPGWNIYETGDGKYVAIGARNMSSWQKLCSLLNCEKYGTFFQADDSTNERIRKDFSRIFKSKSRDQWWSLFRQQGICGAPVYSLEEVEHDPQVKAREMLLEFDLEKGRGVTQYGIPIKLSKTRGKVRHLAQSYGQDTASILKAMGYSGERIKELRTIGAIV